MMALRALHCIPTLVGGGAERQLRLLAPALADLGFDVHVLTDRPAKPLADVTMHTGSVFRAIRRIKPDIVQAWLTPMIVKAGLASVALRVPWILAERASRASYPPTPKYLLRRLVGRTANAIVANSIHGAECWRGHPFVSIVPNTIEAAPPPTRRPEERRDRFIIFSAGRLCYQKNIPLLLNSVTLARQFVPNLLLVMAGDGPDRGAIERQAIEIGLSGSIHFTGHLAEPSGWLLSSDLFISTSRFEGHPNAVLEAAAGGVPMVLSDIPEHRSAVGNGALFASTAPALAAAIARLAKCKASREQVVRAASSDLCVLSQQAAAAQYAGLYRKMVSCLSIEVPRQVLHLNQHISG